MSARRIGFDIGGTFTDLVLVDDASGSISVAKVLTTPSEPATGVGAGIKALLEASGSTASSITR
ncbi:MAG TPA: hydantoinase/oxoprolinase N-terminal domain-containing protein, partial [Gaiellaceae bacterium]